MSQLLKVLAKKWLTCPKTCSSTEREETHREKRHRENRSADTKVNHPPVASRGRYTSVAPVGMV